MMIDLLSIVACWAVATSCFFLYRRVRRLESTEGGIGKAVVEMSQSVGRLQQALAAAEEAAREASARFDERLAEARALASSLGSKRRAGENPEPSAASKRAPDTRQRDPLADVAPRGFRDRSTPAGTQATSKAKHDLRGREALPRFAIAARAADRCETRRDSGAAA
jgi:hypothetical protein